MMCWLSFKRNHQHGITNKFLPSQLSVYTTSTQYNLEHKHRKALTTPLKMDNELAESTWDNNHQGQTVFTFLVSEKGIVEK